MENTKNTKLTGIAENKNEMLVVKPNGCDRDQEIINIFAQKIKESYHDETELLMLSHSIDAFLLNVDPRFQVEFEDMEPLLNLQYLLSASFLELKMKNQ